MSVVGKVNYDRLLASMYQPVAGNWNFRVTV